MNKVIEKLKKWGCDTDKAMVIMADDEQFYMECLNETVGDPCFARLRLAIGDGDIDNAFNVAHTLKGVLANLSLDPLYNKTVEIVELLRRGETDNLSEKERELENLREQLGEIMKS